MKHINTKVVAWAFALLALALITFSLSWPISELRSFFDRAIGIVVLQDVNPSVRNIYYMLGILISFSVISSALWFFQPKIFYRFRIKPLVSTPNSVKHTFVVLCVANAALYTWLDDVLYLRAIGGLCLIGVLHHQIITRIYRSCTTHESVWVIGLSYQLTLTILIVLLGKVNVDGLSIFIFLALILALTVWVKANPDVIYRTVALAWLPMIPIVASELGYFLLQNTESKFSFSVICSVLVVLVICWVVYQCFHTVKRSEPKSFVYRHYLLASVVSSVALIEYSSGLIFHGSYDHFHLGEAVVPAQQSLQFGAIPYIDYYPPHGLFDLFPQFFYALVNGVHDPEMTVWGKGYMLGWLPRMFAAGVFFTFFSLFWGRLTAALIMMFLPVYHLIHPYYALLLIPAIVIFRLPTLPQNYKRWFSLWAVAIAILMWRVDFGVACIAGCTVISVLTAWQQKKWLVLWASVKAGGGLSLGVATVFVVVAIYQSQSPISIAIQILQYFLVQIPLASFPEFINELNWVAFLQLVGLPLVAILPLVLLSGKSVFIFRPLNRLERVVIYLAIVSLVLSFRSLQRHSLSEGVFNQYLFVLIAVIFVCALQGRETFKKYALIGCIAVVSYLVLPQSQDIFDKHWHKLGVAKEYFLGAKDYTFPRWDKRSHVEKPRLKKRRADKEVVAFLKRNLSGSQTFYDFTNSPLLYALAGQKLPSYIMETWYHSSDTLQFFLLKDMDQLRQQKRLPMVLFKQNKEVWDNPDGVSTILRSYRVAEYVYRHYQPCIRVGLYDVWIEKHGSKASCTNMFVAESAQTGSEVVKLVKADYRQKIELGYVPLAWGREDSHGSFVSPLQQYAFEGEGSAIEWDFELPALIRKKPAHLVFYVSAARDSVLNIRYGSSTLSMNIKATSEPKKYVVRPSILFEWWHQTAQRVRVSSETPMVMNMIEVHDGD